MRKHVAIFDTTLRDGLQTPGLPAIPRESRVEIARILEHMRVDVIEAGFPVSSDENFASVRAIAATVKESVICALSMATQESILRCAEALQPAARGRIHLFLGSSPTHLRKLGLTRESMLERMSDAIRFARRHFGDIEFSPEDAGRTDLDFLCRVAEGAIHAGATTINIPDTVGYCMPPEYGARIRILRESVPHDPDKVTWSVHCHDDFGCATANSLSGVEGGARQVECTMYNIGERAGNTAMEEVVMAIRKRQDYFSCDTGIDAAFFGKAAHLVERITQVAIPRNKAVVGRNAFSHESGIHQAGVLKDPSSYEVMTPAEVGWEGRQLTLGAQSGRHALRAVLIELGVELSSNQFEEAYRRTMAYADEHGPVGSDTLLTIVAPLRVSDVA